MEETGPVGNEQGLIRIDGESANGAPMFKPPCSGPVVPDNSASTFILEPLLHLYRQLIRQPQVVRRGLQVVGLDADIQPALQLS